MASQAHVCFVCAAPAALGFGPPGARRDRHAGGVWCCPDHIAVERHAIRRDGSADGLVKCPRFYAGAFALHRRLIIVRW